MIRIFHFNPRTHEECDLEDKEGGDQLLDFNPRTHEECDPSFLRRGRGGQHNFNPRTHEECDIMPGKLSTII